MRPAAWLFVIWCEIVLGKFVKIENLHSKEAPKSNWDNYGIGAPVSPSSFVSANSSSQLKDAVASRGTVPRSYRYGNAPPPAVGGPKLLNSVNGNYYGRRTDEREDFNITLPSVLEMQLDGDLIAEGATKKEWKSFYYPHGTSVLPTATVPFGWSINNNNLLSVPYTPVTAAPVDLTYHNKPAATIQCLLFGVMGLVTFLLNSVMGLLLSAKLPGLGLDGLLGPLLGFGLGFGAYKQEALTADTKAKHMVHFPEYSMNGNQSAVENDFMEQNR